MLKQSQKEFAAATALPRNWRAPHQRQLVDIALRASYEHYQSFVKHLMKSKNIKGMKGRYEAKDVRLLEIAEDVRDMEPQKQSIQFPSIPKQTAILSSVSLYAGLISSASQNLGHSMKRQKSLRIDRRIIL
jgi:hypothetical protein